MPIPVASDPVIAPPRPDPSRPAMREAEAPFEKLLDAAAPAGEAKAAEPRREARRRDKPAHGEEVREVRSNRPSSSDAEPTRTKGYDKAPPPRPDHRADPAAEASHPPTEPAVQGTDGTAASEGEASTPAIPLPTGENIAAILDESGEAELPAPDGETGDPIAAATLPVAPPQPEPAPVAIAVAAPIEAAPETEIPETPAANTGTVAAAIVKSAATPAGSEKANAPAAEADAGEAEAAPAAAAEVETESKPDKPNAPDRRPLRERTVQAGPAAAAPETTDDVAGPAPESRAGATHQPQAAAKEPQPRAAQPQDHELPAPTAKAEAPASQTNATPHVPLPAMGSTALRVTTSPDVAVPVSGLAVEIATRVQNGQKSFEIRLDPPELGRVDVRLDVDRSGQVTTRLTVDRVETLDLLRRDSQTLERALQQAGLKTDGGLEFSLRDQSLAHRDQSQRDEASAQSRIIIPDDEPAAAEAARRGYGRLMGLGGGVDIRV